MIFVLRYFCVISLYGIGLIVFGLFIYFHEYMQLFSCYVCKEYEEPGKIYDYIVVGSGTAGSVVALRLAEDRSNSILLIEAGPISNTLFDIPAIGPLLQLSTIDWQYKTTPQEYACQGLENNASRWPMGRVFGGTARFNNMIHIRGHKTDYEEWFENKTDYNYGTDILQYFKKSENQVGLYKKHFVHNFSGGPLYVNDLPFASPLSEAILKSAKILGFSIQSVNEPQQTGFLKPQANIKNGKRWTTADSLFEKNLKNIRILTNALVTKILFKDNFEAYAVKYTYLGEEKIVRARKAVILSAGVIGTPKILLLSGIGPQKHLSEMKIPVRKDLPVGENLQDHVTTGLDLVVLNQTLPVNVESMISPIAAYDYFFNGKGPWTSVGCEAIGICHSNLDPTLNLEKNKPNLQFMVLPVGITSDGGKHLRKAISVSQKSWDLYFAPMVNKPTITILPIILHPKSKGTVRLKDNNPSTHPVINPNYLSEPEDVEILLQGIELLKKIISTKPMQKLGAQIYKQKFPGCEEHKFDTKSYWECYVRHLTLTSFHPAGTCKMGHPVDSSAVVDYDFKVIGINKLYIADASVMPSLPSGNINAAVAMIAEKVADSIKYYEYMSKEVSTKIEIVLPKSGCAIMRNIRMY